MRSKRWNSEYLLLLLKKFYLLEHGLLFALDNKL